MNWKKWPYWVRGGILALFLLFLLSSIFGVGEVYCKPGVHCSSLWISVLLGYLLSPLERILDNIDSLFLKLFLMGCYYFIFGTFLGWLYGKVKNFRGI